MTSGYIAVRSRFQPTSPVSENTAFTLPVDAAGHDFNPRPPCGRRHHTPDETHGQSNISTHVPRAGDDHGPTRQQQRAKNFNPRPPCGRRPLPDGLSVGGDLFQPTSPVRETTWTCAAPLSRLCHFNPRPPCGRRRTVRGYDQRP